MQKGTRAQPGPRSENLGYVNLGPRFSGVFLIRQRQSVFVHRRARVCLAVRGLSARSVVYL